MASSAGYSHGHGYSETATSSTARCRTGFFGYNGLASSSFGYTGLASSATASWLSGPTRATCLRGHLRSCGLGCVVTQDLLRNQVRWGTADRASPSADSSQRRSTTRSADGPSAATPEPASSDAVRGDCSLRGIPATPSVAVRDGGKRMVHLLRTSQALTTTQVLMFTPAAVITAPGTASHCMEPEAPRTPGPSSPAATGSPGLPLQTTPERAMSSGGGTPRSVRSSPRRTGSSPAGSERPASTCSCATSSPSRHASSAWTGPLSRCRA